jgi:hypothetical protein
MWRGLSLNRDEAWPSSNVRPPRSSASTGERRRTSPTPPTSRTCAELAVMSQTQQVEHTDSISSQDPAHAETKKPKSRRPPSKRHSRPVWRAGRQ